MKLPNERTRVPTPFEMKMDADSEAFFFHEDLPNLKPAFESKVTSFKTFLDYLEVKGIVNPDFVAHSIEAVKEKEGQYEIKTKEECAFEVKKLPNNQTCNHQNALSLLDWKKTWGQGHGPNAAQVRGRQECDWHLPSEAWTVFDERAGDESWEAVLLDQGAEGELEEPGHGME